MENDGFEVTRRVAPGWSRSAINDLSVPVPLRSRVKNGLAWDGLHARIFLSVVWAVILPLFLFQKVRSTLSNFRSRFSQGKRDR